MQDCSCLGDPAFSAGRDSMCSRSPVCSSFSSYKGVTERSDNRAIKRYLVTFCPSASVAFSLVSAPRPLGLGFRKFILNHTHLVLTTQRVGNSLLRCLPPSMLHSPFSFEISARWQ